MILELLSELLGSNVYFVDDIFCFDFDIMCSNVLICSDRPEFTQGLFAYISVTTVLSFWSCLTAK